MDLTQVHNPKRLKIWIKCAEESFQKCVLLIYLTVQLVRYTSLSSYLRNVKLCMWSCQGPSRYNSCFYNLQAIPHAVAMVRAADKKSPREAVEFVLQLLKVITFWVVIIPAWAEIYMVTKNRTFTWPIWSYKPIIGLRKVLSKLNKQVKFCELIPCLASVLCTTFLWQ